MPRRVPLPITAAPGRRSYPCALQGTGSLLEVVHPRGHVVRVPAGFDLQSLRQVLDLLDRQGEA